MHFTVMHLANASLLQGDKKGAKSVRQRGN